MHKVFAGIATRIKTTKIWLMVKDLFGEVFGNQGYISQGLFQELLEQGIFLVTRVKKNKPISTYEKIMLRKRSLIESAFNVLKNKFEIERAKNRAVFNFLVHLIVTLVAYSLTKNKPKISQILHLIPQVLNF